MEIITLAAGAGGLAILAVMAFAPLVADLPLPRRAGPVAAPPSRHDDLAPDDRAATRGVAVPAA